LPIGDSLGSALASDVPGLESMVIGFIWRGEICTDADEVCILAEEGKGLRLITGRPAGLLNSGLAAIGGDGSGICGGCDISYLTESGKLVIASGDVGLLPGSLKPSFIVSGNLMKSVITLDASLNSSDAAPSDLARDNLSGVIDLIFSPRILFQLLVSFGPELSIDRADFGSISEVGLDSSNVNCDVRLNSRPESVTGVDAFSACGSGYGEALRDDACDLAETLPRGKSPRIGDSMFPKSCDRGVRARAVEASVRDIEGALSISITVSLA
jgi:hypothetical protein